MMQANIKEKLIKKSLIVTSRIAKANKGQYNTLSFLKSIAINLNY
jgi:hypothetical protein